MIDAFALTRRAASAVPAFLSRWLKSPAVLVLVCALGLFAGCARSDDIAVKLYARNVSARDPRILEIQAQVSGTLDGVQYKWFASAGQCNPQESTIPVTRFRFGTDSKEDEITVDVWRHGNRIGRGQFSVRLSAPLSPAIVSNLKIEITAVPYADKGGPDTRSEIAGRVTGDIPPDSRVVIYARDEGVWFIQPTTNAKHQLSDEGVWSTWTHSGSAYAALLVPRDFVPLRTLDTIPSLRGDILARVVVDGRPR